MVVLVLSAAPASLRGALTRWLMEVSPGVFVGHLSARVRTQLWDLVGAYIGDGRALLIWSTRGEQRFAVESLGHEKEPVDMEGCLVMRTPYARLTDGQSPREVEAGRTAPESWSLAARRRRYRSYAERALGQQ
ncbi:type I-E CRISPR-associated endoribonuclease Cas2e [Actinomyces weissii]|uniref:Type I-E CRISPR-associated endoribonuclease Cas2 n=1 Tax=Actinomyces weissii TaxID=675090 RepID=A0A7T7MAC3_9ACTO|nr:type I-E CRISPR-associated endoribonuclease Cas2e [Actinomyces weissii]QQM67856.1 type I-E CRISPR-associated endoribonuclease Cas2 [Actinomyces weissii]